MSTTTTSSTCDRFVRLPILPGSKRPVVRDWPNLDPDSPEIAIPFDIFERQGRPINVGWRLDGLMVIDCDSEEGVLWYGQTVPKEHRTPFISSGRPERASFWYRAPQGWDGGTFKPRKDVEVRSGPGAQCVVPPSIHPDTKKPYVWLTKAPTCPSELPVFPALVLGDLMMSAPSRGHAAAPEGQWDCWPEGERDEWLVKVAGWLKEKGATEAALLQAIPALNQALCNPPIKDPERIAKSVARYQDIQWSEDEVGFFPDL